MEDERMKREKRPVMYKEKDINDKINKDRVDIAKTRSNKYIKGIPIPNQLNGRKGQERQNIYPTYIVVYGTLRPTSGKKSPDEAKITQPDE